MLHEDDRERFLPLFKECFDRGEMFNAQYRVLRFDGQYRWFLGRILPVRDCGGNIVHWFGTNTDIHDQKLAELQLNRQVELELNEV
jgi:PAS domain S-box-containing protein